jgi:hypothetical protein
MSVTRLRTILLAVLFAGMTFVSMAGPVWASTAGHHKTWYCAASDYGNIRTELSGKSYICQPDGKRYRWDIIRGRVEN